VGVFVWSEMRRLISYAEKKQLKQRQKEWERQVKVVVLEAIDNLLNNTEGHVHTTFPVRDNKEALSLHRVIDACLRGLNENPVWNCVHSVYFHDGAYSILIETGRGHGH
jgi:hypothetical protein